MSTIRVDTITDEAGTGPVSFPLGIEFGGWTITESGGILYFATGGVNKMKVDGSGNLTVAGNVTAYGTV
jgi:hypothetical protein